MRRSNRIVWFSRFPVLIGLGVALVLGAAPARSQVWEESAGDDAAAEGGELRRGAFTEDQFVQEDITPEVEALQEKQSEIRQQQVVRLLEILEADPYHPNKAELYFRVAEAHWQEAHYQYLRARREFDRAYMEHDAGRLSEPPVEPVPDHSQSLEYYRKIVAEFPQYSRIDEVYYYLGQGALMAGETRRDRALQVEGVRYFQRLVQDYPESRFIAEAHLRLGEYYFENNSLYYAKVNYERIITNHMTSAMYNYALYKLGWVYFNLREFDQAIETFQQVVAEIDAEGGASTGRVEFRVQALNDLIVTYAEIDDGWQHAREYFIKVVGENDAYDRLRRLAELYVAQDRDNYAMELYNHLVDYEPLSQRVPFYLEQLIEVRKRLNLWAETEQEMRRMIDYLQRNGRWWEANKDNPTVLEEANTQAETTLLFIANHYHREAQEKNDQAAYAQAAADYELFLQRFPESKMGYVVNFYFAEILYDNLKDFERAAEQYNEVIRRDRRGEYVEDAALGVIYCYEEMLVGAGLRQAARRGRQIERVRLSAKEVRARAEPIPETELHPLEQSYVGRRRPLRRAHDRASEGPGSAQGEPRAWRGYPAHHVRGGASVLRARHVRGRGATLAHSVRVQPEPRVRGVRGQHAHRRVCALAPLGSR
jgi:cellulose synthase operon protein C